MSATDFANIIGEKIYDVSNPMGFPPDPASSLPPPGLEGSLAANQKEPMISSVQSVWDKITNTGTHIIHATEDELRNVYGGVKNITGTVYDDLKSGAGTVYTDITKPITSALTGTYWYLIGALVVIGGVIYFAGKGGGLKVRI